MELQLVVVMKDQLLLCQAMESDPGQQLYIYMGPWVCWLPFWNYQHGACLNPVTVGTLWYFNEMNPNLHDLHDPR